MIANEMNCKMMLINLNLNLNYSLTQNLINLRLTRNKQIIPPTSTKFGSYSSNQGWRHTTREKTEPQTHPTPL